MTRGWLNTPLIGERCFAGSFDRNSDIGKWFLANGDQKKTDVNAVLYNKSSSQCQLFANSFELRPSLLTSVSDEHTDMVYLVRVCSYLSVCINGGSVQRLLGRTEIIGSGNYRPKNGISK